MTVRIDTSKVSEQIKAFLSDTRIDAMVRETATSMLAEVKTRIHERGLAADGTIIGEYNKTKPLYVNSQNWGLTPMGKNETMKTRKGVTARFASVKTHKEKTKKVGVVGNRVRKDTYFNSYFDFKNAVGRNELGTVNLSLTGQLNNQFVVVALSSGVYGLGWLDEKHPLIAVGMERKYGKEIWKLSPDELEKASLIATKYLSDALS